MAIPTISGARDTANVEQSLRRIDMADNILKLQPSANPLTVFTKRLSKKASISSKIQWAEDDLEDRFDATTGAVAGTSATSIGVGKDIWNVDDLVYNSRTGELMRVQSGLSGGNITVERGIGNSGTGVAINNADELIKVGASSQEHSLSRVARSYNPVVQSNYTEIFKRSVEWSATWENEEQYVQDNDPNYQRGLKGIEHARDIEYAFKFGKPALDTTGAHPRRYTGGAFYYVTTNQTAVGGTMTEATFFGALRPGLRYGGNGPTGAKEKLLLAAPLVVDVLSGYARGKIQVADQSRTVYGVKIVDIVSPHGVLHVATDWSLADSSKFSGYALGLDLDQLRYRYLRNRDTALYKNREENDRDGSKEEYISECGLQFGLEKSHFVLSGITG